MQEWEYTWFQVRWLPLHQKEQKGKTVVEGRWEGADKVAELDQQGWEMDVQYLLGHSSSAMVRRYSATYDAEKAARAHERFSPADRMGERLG
jgi:integrase